MFESLYQFVWKYLVALVSCLGGILYFVMRFRTQAAKEAAFRANIISSQAKAVQDQTEEMVKTAADILERQKEVETSCIARSAVNRWLSEQSRDGAGNVQSASRKAAEHDDAAHNAVTKSSSH